MAARRQFTTPFKPTDVHKTKSSAIMAQLVTSISSQPCSLNLNWGSSRHRCSGTPPASTKDGVSPGSAATDWQEWLQCHLIPGTRALCAVPTLPLWVWTPDCQTHHHSLPQFFSCQACPQRRLWAPARLQTAADNPYRPTEGHQVGNWKRDPRPVPSGQRPPLPTGSFFPSQQLSWTTILVQQNT
jgi:hypothetical protein